jgi:glycosyltransferase involved in cell wall biosynthesis
VTNGVQPDAIVSDPLVRAARRAEFGLPADAPVVGTVAVLTEQKGVTYLLRAAQQLHRVRPDVRWLVVGGGALEQELREQAASLGLDRVVTFTGWRNDAADLLCTFDVFVMSSLWEAMPVALLEAMSARLPIVATEVGQNRAILQQEVGGLIVPPADHGEIASAVRRLLEQPALAASLAANARRRVEDHYTVAHMVRRYEALYERGAGLAPAPVPSAEMERS